MAYTPTGEYLSKAKRGASQRGNGLSITREAIAYREDFVTNGALWGKNTISPRDGNWEPEFVVYSYREPIAVWRQSTGWVITSVKFSATTGRHQSVLRSALYGTEYTTRDSRFGWTA